MHTGLLLRVNGPTCQEWGLIRQEHLLSVFEFQTYQEVRPGGTESPLPALSPIPVVYTFHQV
jgi:hypothetical protein